MKPWKLILAFLVVFIAGAVAGGFTVLRFAAPPFGPPPSGQQIAAHVLREIQSEITLTPAQVGEIRAIILRNADELVAMHRELLTRVRARIDASDREIAAVLDEQQRVKFEKVRAKRPALPGER